MVSGCFLLTSDYSRPPCCHITKYSPRYSAKPNDMLGGRTCVVRSVHCMQLCLGLKILPVQACFDAGRLTRVRRQEAGGSREGACATHLAQRAGPRMAVIRLSLLGRPRVLGNTTTAAVGWMPLRHSNHYDCRRGCFKFCGVGFDTGALTYELIIE